MVGDSSSRTRFSGKARRGGLLGRWGGRGVLWSGVFGWGWRARGICGGCACVLLLGVWKRVRRRWAWGSLGIVCRAGSRDARGWLLGRGLFGKSCLLLGAARWSGRSGRCRFESGVSSVWRSWGASCSTVLGLSRACFWRCRGLWEACCVMCWGCWAVASSLRSVQYAFEGDLVTGRSYCRRGC